MDNPTPRCAWCSLKVPNLRRCAKCQKTYYCDRECQTAHWKQHKAVCLKQAGTVKIFEAEISDPITRLKAGTYLHDRPEKDVYKLLIDSFRLRQEDNFEIDDRVDPDGIYGGVPASLKPFRIFLLLAASRPGLLPPWWDESKQRACVEFGMQEADFPGSEWSNLKNGTDSAGIVEHYGDQEMPMQLRMFSNAVYGTSLGERYLSEIRRLKASSGTGQSG